MILTNFLPNTAGLGISMSAVGLRLQRVWGPSRGHDLADQDEEALVFRAAKAGIPYL